MQRNEYIEKMKQNIQTARVRLDLMAKELKDKSKDTKKEARKTFLDAKDDLNEIDKKLDQLEDVSEDTWESVKDDLDEMWGDISSIVKDDNAKSSQK